MDALSDADLIGAWSLVSSINYRNDVGTPSFGEPPRGQIQYTADHCMSAFLMNPAWAAAGDPAAEGFDDFFAYAGSWRLTGDQVEHELDFCSSPTRIGSRFTRTVTVIDANTIELTTAPETSRSGAVYVTKLVWRRTAA